MTTEERPSSPGAAAKAVAEDTVALVRAEIELAKAEVTGAVQRKMIGAGLLGAAAALVTVAFLALLVAAGLGLVEAGVPGWAAALIIAAALLVVAGVLAAVGRRRVATPVSPEVTKQQVSEDVTWAKQRLRARR